MSDSLTLYKLIILFMLDKVDFPLTTSQISEFILEKEYTNYFTIQQALNELTDSHLVRADTMRGTTYYQNTDEGKNTVTYFGDRIPQAIVDDIMSYLDQNRYTLKNEVSILADYYRATSQDFAVRCQVKEGEVNLIDLTLTVADYASKGTVTVSLYDENDNLVSSRSLSAAGGVFRVDLINASADAAYVIIR